VSFDDPHLALHAGQVPVIALAGRSGLRGLVPEHVRPGGDCGAGQTPCGLPVAAWAATRSAPTARRPPRNHASDPEYVYKLQRTPAAGGPASQTGRLREPAPQRHEIPAGEFRLRALVVRTAARFIHI
jgi:hypothetical protein